MPDGVFLTSTLGGTFGVQSVPEPSSLLAMMAGLAGFGFAAARRARVKRGA